MYISDSKLHVAKFGISKCNFRICLDNMPNSLPLLIQIFNFSFDISNLYSQLRD